MKEIDNNEYEQLIKNLKPLHEKMLEIFDYFDVFCKENNIAYYIYAGTLIGAVRHKGFIPWDDDLDIMMTADNYYTFILRMREKINSAKYYLQEENTAEFPLYFSKLRINDTTFTEKVVFNKNMDKTHKGIFIDIFCLDNAAPTKIGRIIQYFLTKIIIAHAHFRRGFAHLSSLKKVFILFSLVFLPFNSRIFSFTKKYNSKKTYLYAEFFGGNKWRNVFVNKEWISEIVFLEFEGRMVPAPIGYDIYLRKIYGDYMNIPSKKQQIQQLHSSYFSIEKGIGKTNDD
jgi:lipopolysaccharide cholinephosphotransferase